MTFFSLGCLLQQEKKYQSSPVLAWLCLLHSALHLPSLSGIFASLYETDHVGSHFSIRLSGHVHSPFFSRFPSPHSLIIQIPLTCTVGSQNLRNLQACPYFTFLSHQPYSQLCNCISIHHFLPMSNISCIVIPCGRCTSLEATWIWLTGEDIGVCLFVVKW